MKQRTDLVNAHDVHRALTDEGQPHIFWTGGTWDGYSRPPGVSGWYVIDGGSRWGQRLPYPTGWIGRERRGRDGSRVKIKDGDKYLASVSFDTAIEMLANHGVDVSGGLGQPKGRHRSGVWFSRAQVAKVGWKNSDMNWGLPCSHTYHGAKDCNGVAPVDDPDRLCPRHRKARTKSAERNAQWQAEWKAKEEQKERHAETHRSAVETLDQLAADLTNLGLRPDLFTIDDDGQIRTTAENIKALVDMASEFQRMETM